MSPKLIQALKLLAAAFVGAAGALAVESDPVEPVAVTCPPCPSSLPAVAPVVAPAAPAEAPPSAPATEG